MKSFIVIFTLCVAAVVVAEVSEEQKKAMEPYFNECMKETGVTRDELDASKKLKKVDFENKKMGCMSACVFKKISVMTDDGGFDADIIQAFLSEHFPADVVEKAVKICIKPAEADICMYALKGIDCFLNNGMIIVV